MSQENIAVFETPWPRTAASGGKRLSVSQHVEHPDTFIGYGKDRGCYVSGTWWRVMQLATSVLSSPNTERVVEETDIPDTVFINDPDAALSGDRDAYRYTRQPYSYEGRDAYDLSGSPHEGAPQVELPNEPFDLVSVGREPTLLQRDAPPKDDAPLQPDTENRYSDSWVRSLGLGGPRFKGSWWELMCFSAQVLSAAPTQLVVDELPDTVVSEEALLDAAVAAKLDYDEKPYRFVEGAGVREGETYGNYSF